MGKRGRKTNVVLFWFHNDWGRFGRTYENIAIALSRRRDIGQVACVFPPEHECLDAVDGGLWVRRVNSKLTLLVEPVRRRPGVSNNLLRRYLSEHAFTARNTILWLFPPHPYVHQMLRSIPRRLVVAQVMDNFMHFDRDHWLYAFAKAEYPRIADWADVIFTTSEANRQKFARLGKPCHRFFQAVDRSFLATPSELPHRRTGAAPRLGYLGFILSRTDLELLRQISLRRPRWKIVLAGPEYPPGYLAESGLLKRPNVQWLGELPNADAPEFLRSLDVCLMPHKDTAYSRSMSPLKLYQYLASGRPIVATRVAGMEAVVQHVRLATDATTFIAQIEDALVNDDRAARRARIEAARRQTWDVRVREMLDAAEKVRRPAAGSTRKRAPRTRQGTRESPSG